jgi:hypothetical protein
MRTAPLQLLTWGTVAAAVGSAVWLSNTDQDAGSAAHTKGSSKVRIVPYSGGRE